MKNFSKYLKQTQKEFKFYEIRNKNNFNKDFVRLKNKILIDLIKNLNKWHNIRLSNLSWKIFLEPWLTIYISKNIYYWHLIKFNKNKKKNFFYKGFENLEPPFDTIHFTELSRKDDLYNYYMFQKVENFIYCSKKNKTSLVKLKKNIYKQFNFKQYFGQKNSILKIIYHKFLAPLLNNNKIIFDLSDIGINKLKLNFNFYQLPCWLDYMFNFELYGKLFKERSPTHHKLRDSFKKNYKKKNFYNFITSNIYDDLPKVFLEDFKKVADSIKQIKLKPKIIVSDCKEFDLFFKFWVSLNKFEKIKFISSDHGGSYMSNLDDMTHEESSNYSLRWFKYKLKNSIQLPILKNLKKRVQIKNRSKVLIIAHGVDKYPHHVLWSPIGKENLFQRKLVYDFTKRIKSDIKKNLFLKTYPDKLVDSEWSCNKHFKKIFPEKKIIYDATKFKEIFSISKLNICLYPQTAFIESILSGPTILLIHKDFYRIRPELENIHFQLKKVKILFNDGFEAINHVNKVWGDIDNWWENKEVLKVRKIFEKTACKKLGEKETLRQWTEFFKKLN